MIYLLFILIPSLLTVVLTHWFTWVDSRNLINVVWLGFFLALSLFFLIRKCIKKPVPNYLKFLISFIIGMILVNYSFILV